MLSIDWLAGWVCGKTIAVGSVSRKFRVEWVFVKMMMIFISETEEKAVRNCARMDGYYKEVDQVFRILGQHNNDRSFMAIAW